MGLHRYQRLSLPDHLLELLDLHLKLQDSRVSAASATKDVEQQADNRSRNSHEVA